MSEKQSNRDKDWYIAAMKELLFLMRLDPKRGTPPGDRLAALADQLGVYEQQLAASNGASKSQ
jgi:hypothetical protein